MLYNKHVKCPWQVVGNSIAVTVASQLLRLLLHGEVHPLGRHLMVFNKDL